jgi:hypothetical protein
MDNNMSREYLRRSRKVCRIRLEKEASGLAVFGGDHCYGQKLPVPGGGRRNVDLF